MTDRHGLLVVIAGPSGVGKGTVHTRVRQALPDSVLSISVTTRLPRPGEREGVDYRFVDREEFDQQVASGGLYEWAEYAGHSYGTPRRPVREAIASGRVVLLDIELQGALQIKEQDPDALLIFLVPPSFEELERRLRERGTEDDAAVERRLQCAREELAAGDRFDAQIVNDDLDHCVAEVLGAIDLARARPPRD